MMKKTKTCQVDCVEHDLDAEQHRDAVAAEQHARRADREQEAAEDEEMGGRYHHFSASS
jgi:hypothetical protein